MIKQKKISDVKENWVKIFGELSYCGKKKPKIYASYDAKWTKEGWLPAHFFQGEVISRDKAYELYEEGYYQYLKNNMEARKKIVTSASEVYDIAPSNLSSGLDYNLQECTATHLQDIAVRRALIRLRLEELGITPDKKSLPHLKVFEGDHLVQIRDHTTEGYFLNPGKVPFHLPEAIINTTQHGWWDTGSVEDWYQRNKVLLVDPDKFKVQLVMSSPVNNFFSIAQESYYSTGFPPQVPESLRHFKGKDARGLYSRSNDITEIISSPILSWTEWKSLLPKLNLKLDRRRVDFNGIARS